MYKILCFVFISKNNNLLSTLLAKYHFFELCYCKLLIMKFTDLLK